MRHRRNLRSPRVIEVPINDGRWTQAEYAALVRRARQAFDNRDIDQLRRWELEDAMQREHEAHERSVKEWERRDCSQKISQITVIFHVVHLQQELPLCVHFLMSMQHFVKVIPLWLHIHNQSSRRLHRLWEGRCHQSSIQTRNLQGLVLHMQPPPPATSRPDAAQGLNLPLASTPVTPCHPPRPPIDALPKHPSMETGTGATKHPLEPPVQQGPPHKHVRSKAFPYGQSPPQQTSMAAPSAVDMSRPGTPCPKGPPAEYMPAPPEVMSMSTGASAVVQEPYVTDEWQDPQGQIRDGHRLGSSSL